MCVFPYKNVYIYTYIYKYIYIYYIYIDIYTPTNYFYIAICIMFICVHLFFESSSIFSRYFCIDVFGITWKVTCSKRFTQLKDL